MKNIKFFFAAMALMAASCTNESFEQSSEQAVEQSQLTPVTVRVDGFAVSQSDFPAETRTRAAQDVADYDGVSSITLAFYASNGTEAYKSTQSKNDADFGEFECSLPMGSYTMVVLGYGLNDGEPAITLTSSTEATFGSHPARETFVATQAVNITNTNDVSLSATLNRIVSKLKIHSTDGCTENAVSIRTTFSAGGKAFNPTTGLATSNTGFINVLPIQSTVGNSTNSNNYLFLATDEQTMTVTIDVLDTDGNIISHKVVNNVPLKRNRMTQLTGSLYSAGSNASFLIETDWLPETNVDF